MKKYFLAVLTLISLNELKSQNLTLTADGLVSSDDNTKKYVVIEIPDISASELYKNSNIYIQKNYKSPKDVIKGQVENNFLSFNTHTDKIAYYNIPLNGRQNIQADFTITLDFKDSRVKFEVLNLEMYYYSDYKKVSFNIRQSFSGWSIFNKKGGLNKKAETTKVETEKYFNDFIANLKVGLSGIRDDNNSW